MDNNKVLKMSRNEPTKFCSYCGHHAVYKEVTAPTADIWGNTRQHIDYACSVHANVWMGEDNVTKADMEAHNTQLLEIV